MAAPAISSFPRAILSVRSMRSTALLLFLLICGVGPVWGQCADYASSIRWLAGEGSPPFVPGYGNGSGSIAIAKAGTKVLVIDDPRGLVAFEETSPGHLTYRSQLELEAWDLDAVANRAYVIGGTSGFVVINTTDLQHLTTVATLPVSGERVDVEAGYAYIATATELTIVRITEPAIAVVGHLPGAASRVAVRGTRAYVITPSGLRIANVANPAAPTYLPALYAEGDLADLGFQGNYLQVIAYSSGLRTFDLSDPDQLALVADLPMVKGEAVTSSADRLLCGSGGEMTVVDTSDPEAPQVRGSYRALTCRGAVLSQGVAYLAAGFYGVQTLNLGTGGMPSPVFATGEGAFARNLTVLGGTLVFLQSSSALRTFDVSAPAAPVPLGLLPLTNASAMAVEGNHAFVVDANVFKVIDLSTPSAPIVVGSLPGVSGSQVMVSGGRAYVVGQNATLSILDVSVPTAPALLSVGYVWSGGEGMEPMATLIGQSLYVGDSFEGTGILTKWDVSNPNNVQWIGETYLDGRLAGLSTGFGQLLLTTRGEALVVDPDDLQWNGFSSLGVHSFGSPIFAGSGGRAYTLVHGGYRVLSYDGVLHYVGSGSVPAPGYSTSGIVEVGGYVYVADSNALHVFPPTCGAAGAPLAPELPEEERAAGLTCAPNPFGASSSLNFSLDRAMTADLRIFDLSGRSVRTLLAGRFLGAGRQSVSWDGRDDLDRPMRNGVYFARLTTPAGRWTQRIERLR